MISISGDKLSIQFSSFGLDAYQLFLKSKKLPESNLEFHRATETYTLTAPARFAGVFGLQAPAFNRGMLDVPSSMHDYQRELLFRALEVKRFAHWWDCGLGKAFEGLEWMRQVAHRTGGRVLAVTLNGLVPELNAEALKFYKGALKLVVLKTRAELIAFCKGPADGTIAVTNYEKFIDGVILELKWLAGLWLDESSILKCGGGVIKWNVLKSARGIEYKLSTTATPAPNDIMEYASQAGFLEKLKSETDILWTFFSRDKFGVWQVKPHAMGAFYAFMSSWSIYLRNPARYGWKDNLKSIPAPCFYEHLIEATPDQLKRAKTFVKAAAPLGNGHSDEMEFDDGKIPSLGIVGRNKLSQLAKGFLYIEGKKNLKRVMSHKPGFVAKLARQELAQGRQCLIWTAYDEETAILAELTRGCGLEVLTGSTAVKDRAAIIERFKRGQSSGLITRGELLGFGQNFQHCRSMIFSAFTDSFEDFYQMVRRAYRYGQTESVHIHIPIVNGLEEMIWANVSRKAVNFERGTEIQEEHYVEAMRLQSAA